MNPDLEVFLQNALGNLERGDSPVARVAVEPDYESGTANVDAKKLAGELRALLMAQHPNTGALSAHEGVEVPVGSDYPELLKSIRRVFLHGDKEDGPWVEVIPPGNWI